MMAASASARRCASVGLHLFGAGLGLDPVEGVEGAHQGQVELVLDGVPGQAATASSWRGWRRTAGLVARSAPRHSAMRSSTRSVNSSTSRAALLGHRRQRARPARGAPGSPGSTATHRGQVGRPGPGEHVALAPRPGPARTSARVRRRSCRRRRRCPAGPGATCAGRGRRGAACAAEPTWGADRRTDAAGGPRAGWHRPRRSADGGVVGPGRSATSASSAERQVDPHQRLLLLLGEVRSARMCRARSVSPSGCSRMPAWT